MKVAPASWPARVGTVIVAIALIALAAASVEAQQSSRATPTTDYVGQAYEQFLLGRRLEAANDVDGAIVAFKKAAQLDPGAADVVAELAGLYMRQSRLTDAIAAGEQALKIAPTNREAHRVLGIIYATLAEGGRRGAQRGSTAARPNENIAKAIDHLEQALERPNGDSDPNVRATLARLYIAAGTFDKAIPILADLVEQEPGWNDGPALLAEAYAGAGRDDEAVQWLEQAATNDPDLYPTLGEFYERQRKWKDAARAFAEAVKRTPRNADLKYRYASALLQSGGGRDAVTQARDVLNEIVTARANDTRALYLLSQAERRLGDYPAAEAAARKVIAQNGRSPMGYYALATTLEERRQYQAVVDTLAPVVAEFRTRTGQNQASDLALLLPHLAFAYQELGDHDKAIAAFDEAHKAAPDDATIFAYLIQANVTGKRYPAAIELARKAMEDHPDDLRFARLEAQALRQTGKPDEGAAVLQQMLRKQPDKPDAYVALAQLYSEAKRGADAVKVLQEAQSKFPDDTSIPFELGAVLEKQKRYADAESAFRQVLAKEPEHAPALNYLGYMLADRGERLDESIGLLKKALALEPENGSFLDSIGWAYYKSDKLDLALDNLQRAADQLPTNSVIQDHFGDALFKAGRYDDAVSAWTRALAGDGDSIDRGSVDKKIKSARQKLGKK